MDTIRTEQVRPNESVVRQQKARKMPGEERIQMNRTLAFFIFLLIFLLLGLLRLFHPKYINELFKMFERGRIGGQAVLGTLESNDAPKYLFTVIYFLSAGYFIAKVYAYFTNKDLCLNDPKIISLGLLTVIGVYIYKYLIVHLMAWLFKFNQSVKGLFQYIGFTNQVSGMVLLPICAFLLLCLNFGNTFLIILGLFVLLISLVIKYLANVSYLKQVPRVNSFHFILYLCALEIIPFAVLGRWLVNNL